MTAADVPVDAYVVDRWASWITLATTPPAQGSVAIRTAIGGQLLLDPPTATRTPLLGPGQLPLAGMRS